MTDGVGFTMARQAELRVGVAPWRLRRRQLRSSLIREHAGEVLNLADDVESLLVTVGVWLLLVVAAPVIVLVLAILLWPVEVTLAVIVAVGVLMFRFTGLIRWTVVLTDDGGIQTVETYRNIVRAIRRVRDINQSSKIAISFGWR